tara:strand:- start:215225 stop:215914 length:690 start_codon:yes stop_codon:yes gene_type:complete
MKKEMFTKAQYILGPLVFLGLFVGIVAYAANFTHPGAGPTNSNPAAPLHIGSTNQVKEAGLSVRNLFGQSRVTGQNEVCIGSDCRSAWPSGSSEFSTSCQVHTLTIADVDGQPGAAHENTRITQERLAENCDGQLTQEEKDLGFMMVSFDNCPGVSGRDCSGASYCKYIRFECDAGITFEEGSFAIANPNPDSQCSDGRDNDNDGRTDMDDINCETPDDNNESGGLQAN